MKRPILGTMIFLAIVSFCSCAIEICFDRAKLGDVLSAIVEASGIEIVVSPDLPLDREITIRVRAKTWEEALKLVAEPFGARVVKEGNIFFVLPKGRAPNQQMLIVSLSGFPLSPQDIRALFPGLRVTVKEGLAIAIGDQDLLEAFAELVRKVRAARQKLVKKPAEGPGSMSLEEALAACGFKFIYVDPSFEDVKVSRVGGATVEKEWVRKLIEAIGGRIVEKGAFAAVLKSPKHNGKVVCVKAFPGIDEASEKLGFEILLKANGYAVIRGEEEAIDTIGKIAEGQATLADALFAAAEERGFSVIMDREAAEKLGTFVAGRLNLADALRVVREKGLRTKIEGRVIKISSGKGVFVEKNSRRVAVTLELWAIDESRTKEAGIEPSVKLEGDLLPPSPQLRAKLRATLPQLEKEGIAKTIAVAHVSVNEGNVGKINLGDEVKISKPDGGFDTVWAGFSVSLRPYVGEKTIVLEIHTKISAIKSLSPPSVKTREANLVVEVPKGEDFPVMLFSGVESVEEEANPLKLIPIVGDILGRPGKTKKRVTILLFMRAREES